MKQKKRNYSKSFKEKAVSLSYQRENIKELAIELGIHVDRIYSWRTDARLGKLSTPANSAVSGSRKPANVHDSMEVKRLKKELKEAQMDLAILKKAIHIFSTSDGKNTNL